MVLVMPSKPLLLSRLDGERGRNRTYNLLIKSQLLCQLSYAPFLIVLQRTRSRELRWADLYSGTDWLRNLFDINKRV